MSDGNERYSVAQMADLLFGAQEPYHCYAAHRMLSEDRILFKQVWLASVCGDSAGGCVCHGLIAYRMA